jgi:hypothetical protein
MEERRRIIRWQVDMAVRVRHAAEEGHFPARLKDLSLKGLSLISRERLSKDAGVKLQVAFEAGVSLEFEAWICWHRAVGETNCYGLYFTKIDDQNKEGIFRFVRKNQHQEFNKVWYGETRREEGGEKMEDKRIFERFAKRLPLRFLDLNAFQEGSAQTEDISAKGIGFISDVELKANTPLELWVEAADKGEPIYARGEVVWSEAGLGGQCRVGVNLEKANLMGLSRVLR